MMFDPNYVPIPNSDGPNPRQKFPRPPAGGGGPQMSPADEAQQLQRAYRQFLGRPATPQEIQGWLSGAYGHGQSGNLLPIFEAIRTSPEAQQRPPVNRPMGLPDVPRPGGGYPARPEGPSRSPWDPTGSYPTNLPPGTQTMRPQGGPSAKPLGGQDVQRMRRAILGVPEY
jgi:hypothetical protein